MCVTDRHDMTLAVKCGVKLQYNLPTLEFGKIAESDFVYTLASTNINQISTKLSENVCDHKILDKFDYGFNRIRTVQVICS